MIGNIELDSDNLANVMKVSVLIDDDHIVVLTPHLFSSGSITSLEWSLSPPFSSGLIWPCPDCTVLFSDKPSPKPDSTSLQVMTNRTSCSRFVLLNACHFSELIGHTLSGLLKQRDDVLVCSME
jgi:hypothetical protein